MRTKHENESDNPVLAKPRKWVYYMRDNEVIIMDSLGWRRTHKGNLIN